MTPSPRLVEKMGELADMARPPRKRAGLRRKIERYRMLLLDYQHDRRTVRALLAEIGDLETQLR